MDFDHVGQVVRAANPVRKGLAPYLRAFVPAAFGLLLLMCGGNSPTGSTPPVTTPPTTKPPATQPTPSPAHATCDALGYVPSPNTRCSSSSAQFESKVDAAIAKVMAEHGEIFENGAGGIRAKNFGKFMVEVIQNVDAQGVCAGFDGEELQVKNSNDFNEQFKISASAGWVRTSGSYQTTCKPAAFPTPPPPPIAPPAGCTLPSSQLIACGPASASFLGQMKDAIDQVVREHPEIFNTRHVIGDDGYEVLDIQRYHAYVAAAVTQRGLCAYFDGEEMNVKQTNEFTDHYDILTGENYIRRGDGEYQTSCYPAAF